jgi:hypothetical protein
MVKGAMRKQNRVPAAALCTPPGSTIHIMCGLQVLAVLSRYDSMQWPGGANTCESNRWDQMFICASQKDSLTLKLNPGK